MATFLFSADTNSVLFLFCDSDFNLSLQHVSIVVCMLCVFDLFLVVGKIKLEFCVF